MCNTSTANIVDIAIEMLYDTYLEDLKEEHGEDISVGDITPFSIIRYITVFVNATNTGKVYLVFKLDNSMYSRTIGIELSDDRLIGATLLSCQQSLFRYQKVAGVSLHE